MPPGRSCATIPHGSRSAAFRGIRLRAAAGPGSRSRRRVAPRKVSPPRFRSGARPGYILPGPGDIFRGAAAIKVEDLSRHPQRPGTWPATPWRSMSWRVRLMPRAGRGILAGKRSRGQAPRLPRKRASGDDASGQHGVGREPDCTTAPRPTGSLPPAGGEDRGRQCAQRRRRRYQPARRV